MSRFITPLDVKLIDDVENKWELLAPLAYISDVAGRIVSVPTGFVTDFASVPRLPFVYLATGDTAHGAAVVHDYLYSTGVVRREIADQVLLEAMAVSAVPAWRRYAMYWAVRLFGAADFKSRQGNSAC